MLQQNSGLTRPSKPTLSKAAVGNSGPEQSDPTLMTRPVLAQGHRERSKCARNAEASGGFYDHNLVVNRAGIDDGDLALVRQLRHHYDSSFLWSMGGASHASLPPPSATSPGHALLGTH